MKYLSLSLILICSTFGIAQKGLSARDAVLEALEYNFNILSANKRVQIAEKNNRWSEAGLFPTVSLSAGYNAALQDNSNNPLSFVQGSIVNENLNPAVNMNWNLFSGLGIKISKERLALLESQSKGNLMAEVENISLEVLKTYYNILLQEEKLKVYKELLLFSKEQYSYYKLKEDYGQSNSLETFQFKNQFFSDSINVIQQEVNLKNAQRNLLVLINMPNLDLRNFQLPKLQDSLTAQLSLLSKDEILNNLSANNQNLCNQYIALELQEKMIDYRRSFLFPVVSLRASASPSWGRLRFTDDPSNIVNTEQVVYTGGINIQYNLFNNYKTKRAVEVAKIDAEIGALTYDQMKIELESNSLQLFDQYALQNQLVDLSDQSMEYAQRAYDLGKTKFEQGIINSLDLQNLRNNYLNAALSYYDALYNRMTVYLDIYKISGKLQLTYSN